MTIHVLGATDLTTHYGLEVDGAIKKFSDPDGASWAMVARPSMLGPVRWIPVAQIPSPSCRRVVLASGRLADDGSELSGSWGGWSPRGQAAFESEIERLAPALSALGIELVLWPRVGDALSDIPSCLSFLRRHASGPFRLLLEPAALLDESMLARAGEHLERIVDSLAEQASVVALMASNVEFANGAARCVQLGRGVVSGDLIGTMVARLSATGKPLILRDRDDASAVVRSVERTKPG